MERFFVAPETAEIVPLPSFQGTTGSTAASCSVVRRLPGWPTVGGRYVPRRSEEAEAVRALSIRHN
ncbi:hypothetical protein CF54_00155 [Streptomyces sp. Tu 6176]|nr:hypothetical protein CF54_00155 [Streptomyces sp. Tu 6176]